MQLFVPDDEHLGSDVVFGVTRHLVGDFVYHGPDQPAPEPRIAVPWYSLGHAVTMEPGEATLPVPPIA